MHHIYIAPLSFTHFLDSKQLNPERILQQSQQFPCLDINSTQPTKTTELQFKLALAYKPVSLHPKKKRENSSQFSTQKMDCSKNTLQKNEA